MKGDLYGYTTKRYSYKVTDTYQPPPSWG